MKQFRNRETGELKTQAQIMRENPGKSFPKKWPAALLDRMGYDPVIASPKPDPSGDYKIVVKDGAVQDANGHWVDAWVERDMFVEMTDMDGNTLTVADQIATYEQNKSDEAARSVRTRRDQLLKDTDWMGLSDVTMSTEWETYRQALRDISSHTNFPFLDEEDWPSKPV